ncbi:MAG TPA: methyltransferase domain-containing protein [Polyangiaceae bacterium]|jgi:trans-aconitate methyltransferase|nr:methyltransferase domain-containing protein [Polyangiaceae bacterium]
MNTPTAQASTLSPSQQTWDPALYGARAAFVHTMAADLVTLLAPRAGEQVLDLGCGGGELALAIQATGASVVGVDGSAAMVEAARARAAGATASGRAPSFVVGDGQALAYDGAFDAVFSNAALHWMPRAADVARGVFRALVPGGRFVAEFGGHGCIARLRAGVAEALVRRGEDPGAYLRWYFPRLSEYAALLADAGFEVRLAHLFDRPTPVDGADGLSAWLRTFLPVLEAKLGPAWPAFTGEVEASCAEALRKDGANGGSWTLDYVRLRVVAVRP